MQDSLRKAIRARDKKLPPEKRMSNLAGAFCVWRVLKELLRREGRHPLDVIALGGECQYRTVNTVMKLDLVAQRCKAMVPMNTPRKGHATVVLDGKLFAIGGSNFFSLSNVECLDLATGQWSAATPMTRVRVNHSAAVLGGKIFVAGGQGLVGNSVESYDPVTREWTTVAPMNTSRAFHSLVSAQGKLFAVGGSNPRDGNLKSVECFNPSTGMWTNIAPLNTARYGLEAAFLGDKLYAIGGVFRTTRLSSVECLDLSIPNSGWAAAPPMGTARAGMGAVGTSGKIYVIGGWSTNIECFDPHDGPRGRWTAMAKPLAFSEEIAKFAVC